MKVVQNRWEQGHWLVDVSFSSLNSSSTLVLAFGDLSTHLEVLDELKSCMPDSHILGATTAGEIYGLDALENKFVVTVIQFEHTELRSASITFDNDCDYRQLGRDISTEILDENLKAVLLLSEGVVINGSELVNGCKEVLPNDVLLTGGLAGDDTRFSVTHTVHNDNVATQQIVALGLYSEVLEIGVGSCGGWSGFGPVRCITKSKCGELIELDGEPALSVYKNYLGELSAGLPYSGLRYPMQLFSETNDCTLVRTLVGLDEANGSIFYAGDMPQGAKVQLMKATVNSLVDGAENAAQQAKAHHQQTAEFALLISCVGRKHVLKQLVEDELEAVQLALGEQTTMTGFYSYGEIAPHTKGGEAELHNQTMTITTFRE